MDCSAVYFGTDFCFLPETMNLEITILSKLKNRYLRLRLTEVFLIAIFVASITFVSLYVLQIPALTRALTSLLAGVAGFVFRSVQLRLHKITAASVASFLNTRYEVLAGSTDLLLTEEHALPPLARLQRSVTHKKLEGLSDTVKFPNHLKTFAFLAATGLILCALLVVNDFHISPFPTTHTGNNPVLTETRLVKNLPPEIAEVTVVVAPPAYTNIRPYPAADLNLTVQEKSQVMWSIHFTQPVKKVELITASQDTLKFLSDNERWNLAATLDRNGFYQLAWRDEGLHTSDYYKIIVIHDQPPAIQLPGLNQFTQVAHNERKSIEVNPILADDYGLTDAYIIATVSKGSGESVKFREEKIRFASPGSITGKKVNARQSLDLAKLGLEPGDELYFYVEALDNRTPLANRARTETYFVTIPDTAQNSMAIEGGLGVDLMPEYFRSQRQIIIDTEKLIREKKTITKNEFASRSNELGYDQKVLRLRYGQFMGEEAESGIAPVDHHEEDHDGEEKKPEDMMKEFGHQHDTENEHNLVEEKDPTKKAVDGSKKEDLMAAFLHAHDNEESATFFFQSLKIKLKAALTQMWDAELYLRLYEPEKSLPYQYTALRLLKEISNDSRIYVHRTGFEPPPIKEEKRLSADLTEITHVTRTQETHNPEHYPNISAALRVTEQLLARQAFTLTPQEKNILMQSGSELAQAALENPSLLPGLSALHEITLSEKAPAREALKTLQKAYVLALPKQPAQAGKTQTTLHDLDTKLLQQLELMQP